MIDMGPTIAAVSRPTYRETRAEMTYEERAEYEQLRAEDYDNGYYGGEQ